jgi:hypothetical protein
VITYQSYPRKPGRSGQPAVVRPGRECASAGPPAPGRPAGNAATAAGRAARTAVAVCRGGAPGRVRQRPAAERRTSTRSVRSQEKSGSSRPKWPNAAVWE